MADPDRTTVDIEIVPNNAALNRRAAQEFQCLAESAIAARGKFAVTLSGGNTPRAIYSLLAQQYKTTIPWDKVHIFFSDERHVPPDHPDSNYRMAKESLLANVPIPEKNIHRVRTEMDAASAAQDYDNQLREFFHLNGNDWPRFDLIMLGLGDDGHTASLFPGTAALDESRRRVVANWVEKLKSFRITFTFPLLNYAAEVLFLVSGANKAKILKEVLEPGGTEVPAQRVLPKGGRLLWLADQDAGRPFCFANPPKA
jgi:6-phosphogluconolactonase